jgi:hypothetical protein
MGDRAGLCKLLVTSQLYTHPAGTLFVLVKDVPLKQRLLAAIRRKDPEDQVGGWVGAGGQAGRQAGAQCMCFECITEERHAATRVASAKSAMIWLKGR